MKRKWNRRINFKPTNLTYYLTISSLTFLIGCLFFKSAFSQIAIDFKNIGDCIMFIIFLILSFTLSFLLSLLLTIPLAAWCEYERSKK